MSEAENIIIGETISLKELDHKIKKAHSVFLEWRNTIFEERKNLFHKLGDIMESQIDELAKLDTEEMGMLYKDAKGDVKKSITNIRYFADNADSILSSKPFNQDGINGEIRYEPLGPIFSIMPWNYPYNQVLRSVVPNIMAGNTVLLKHASNVPQVAQKIEELFRLAGFPDGVYTNLFIGHEFTENIIIHPLVRGANVTGSEKIGRLVGSLAGKYLKPSVLELGGNDAFVLLETSNIDEAIGHAIKGRFSNHGQKCNSSKRFIIIESMYNVFCERFAESVSKLKVGDPFNENTQIGPLAKESVVLFLDQQVKDDIQNGATLLTGGCKAKMDGNYYLPTVLCDVNPGMRTFDEETFGPVAAIIKAKDVNEIISLINNSKFGLGCSIFGDNMDEKKYIAQNAEVGNVFIDNIVTSYAFLPYGGIKETGYGNELGEAGLKAFVNEKVIVF